MFDNEERVALFDQLVERVEQAAVVAFVQPDGRFVEHVENAAEIGSELRGKADALGLAAGERCRGAIERQVVESDALHEAEALADFRKDVRGKCGIVAKESHVIEKCGRLARASLGEVGNGMSVHLNMPCLGVQTHAAALGAGTGDVLVGFFACGLFLEVGLQLGAGIVRAEVAVVNQSESAAGLAPSVRRVERKHARIERFESAGAGRASHLRAE